MGFYFENHHSMFSQVGMQVGRTLDGIVRRYLGLNPPHPLTHRPFDKRGILRGKDYRYAADLNALLPGAKAGQFAYAWAKIWSDGPSEILFDINCQCPTVVYRDQEIIFRSTIFQERYAEERNRLTIALRPGWNHFVLRFKKTRAGFGGVFGTWLGKLPYYFLKPTESRDGEEGWLYSDPVDDELLVIPGAGLSEEDTGLTWHPRSGWGAKEAALGQLQRIFGTMPDATAIAWTRASFMQPGVAEYTLSGDHRSTIAVFIDDERVFSSEKPGAFETTIKVGFGERDVMVRSECRGSAGWGFTLALADATGPVPFTSACNIAGGGYAWMFAGPFAKKKDPDLAALRDFHNLVPAIGGNTYWRLDAPETWVRPYNDNALFGKWNYPLGVTLYGLLHSARAIGSEETQQYVLQHVQRCCDTYRYAMWDRQQYGGATNVHHLLTSLDSLDDCGSFGSAMLDVAQHLELRNYREIADLVADYIENKQIRLPDGTFFRKNLMHEFHEDTMWADDLYMSVPFLCRYYQLSGQAKYIDDAARQFLGFRKLLYIPELKVMSHVYDFTRKMATGIPWGRANGWVIFSLSELLAVLPADHALRPELLAMFRELSEGFLALQDEAGMWHQVLSEHDSYPETSCTSMFTYAFARGVQFGWLEQPDPYVRSVYKAWEALNRVSIDRFGNIHGVCRGSEFSFTSDYYKKDLLWNLNDTHGIGIVLLAGVEVIRLTKHLRSLAPGRSVAAPALVATG
jgi:rhamnogalacturonyl hydrolase YesR